MNKKIVKSSLLALSIIAGNVLATDFHAPLPGGPLRYDFEKFSKKGHFFNVWSTGYMREADKAYLKSEFKAHPLTALIFGQDQFTVSQSFETGSDNSGYTQYGNGALSSTTIAPRASFSEQGVVVGACWSCPVWANKGRIGLRGSIPLRNIRVERDQDTEAVVTGNQENYQLNQARVMPITETGTNKNPAKVMYGINNYKMTYLQQIKTLQPDGTIQPLVANIGTNTTNIAGTVHDQAIVAATSTSPIPFVIFKSSQAGKAPTATQGGAMVLVAVDGDKADQPKTGSTYIYTEAAKSVGNDKIAAANNGKDGALGVYELPLDTSTVVADKAYAFIKDTAYTAQSTKLTDLWLTTVHGSITGAPIAQSLSASAVINNAIGLQNNNIAQFFANSGYIMQTYDLTGLGDADLDLFYEHSFSSHFAGEIYAGVRFPTGAGDKLWDNPFKMCLGNGNHFELRAGLKGAWKVFKCMDINADAHYSFAINAKEHRMAAFQGATIKNMGPHADADVDWSYFNGTFDFTFFHPKTRNIATTIGYEFYYKTEDHISFKNATSTTFLGNQWQQANGKPADSTDPGKQWGTYKQTLSNATARMGTEAIAHRGYVEGSYNLSEYLTMRVGGKYTFAGQNMPADGEAFAGINVKF